jgi:M6 family metalloprotease-like protein
MRKRLIALLVITPLLLSSQLSTSHAAAKAGAKCSKVGSKSVVGAKTFTCIKSGKKLVWNKGIKVVAGSNPTPASAPTNITDCKLPVADGRGDVSIGGWPRIADRMRTTGTINVQVVMVDFPDAVAKMTPQAAFAMISGAANTFNEVSYGRMQYNLIPNYKWYRMKSNSTTYAPLNKSFLSHRAYIEEALAMADPDVDFSKADSFVILANPDSTGIGNSGPAFSSIRSTGFTLDGKYIANGATSSHDLNYWKSIWLNHEITHTMGLVDVYAATQSNPANRYDGFRYTGEFSYMGFSSFEGNAPSLFAFERWNLGWIDDSQIKCLKDINSTELISPVQTSGGVKAVIIPISRTKAVVIESRRASGIDKNIAKSGALVYVVDSSIQSGQGPVKVFPSDLSGDPRYLKAPRALGESVTTEGITVKVTKSDDSGDTVEITKS